MTQTVMKHSSFLPNWKNLFQFMKDPNSDWKPKAAVLLAIVYLVWPIDLIPDFAPILGWLDDIGVTAIAITYLLYTANRYEQKKNESPNNQITELPKE